MASKEHLGILRQGVDAWNTWRKNNPSIVPDLEGSVLSDTIFQGNTPSRPANLKGIDLSRACLYRTVLKGANLQRADLRAANLRAADLRRADCQYADFSRASLHQTNLTLAILCQANMTEALLWETVLARVDLTGVTGLDSCRHGGPSILDHRTVRRSSGLPVAFQRGCGLPEELIQAFAEFAQSRARFPSCFISYASTDERFARKLYADLQENGVRCWFAPEDMKTGARLRVEIDESIIAQDKLLLILSESSVHSPWVEKEVEAAFEQERQQRRLVLLPIRLDDAILDSEFGWPADIRRSRHIGDFRGWMDEQCYVVAVKRLLRDLATESLSQNPGGRPPRFRGRAL